MNSVSLNVKPSKWLMQQAKPYQAALYYTVLLGVLGQMLTIIFLGLVAYIIYVIFILKFSILALNKQFIWMLIIIIARSTLVGLKELSGFKISAAIRTKLRKNLITHFNQLGPIKNREYSSGELVTVLIEHIESLNEFYVSYLPQMYFVILIPLLILSIVFYFNWLAGLILLLCGPLIPLFMALIGMGAAAANNRNFVALTRMSIHFLDVLQGLTTLKQFNRSKAYAQSIELVSDHYRQQTMNVLRIAFMSSGVLEFFSAASIALVAMLLGLTLLGKIDFGYYSHINLFDAMFILLLAPEFFLPLRELGTHYHARAEAIAAAEKIIQFLSLPINNELKNNIFVKDKIITIQFDQVSFSYQKNTPLLKNINFTLQPGKHVYLIGASGTGKTTILNLMMGLILPNSGNIKINHQDLNSISQESWLANIAWIGQNPKLFHGTLLDNLHLANPKATMTEINTALQLANAAEFISLLPNGLQTVIDEQGIGLSGGQIQRFALARVWLKNAPILLFDEPTANLDQVSECEVLDAIQNITKDKTVFILTHRLNIIPEDAEVWLLQDGELIEKGIYKDLQSQNKKIKNMQQLEKEEMI